MPESTNTVIVNTHGESEILPKKSFENLGDTQSRKRPLDTVEEAKGNELGKVELIKPKVGCNDDEKNNGGEKIKKARADTKMSVFGSSTEFNAFSRSTFGCKSSTSPTEANSYKKIFGSSKSTTDPIFGQEKNESSFGFGGKYNSTTNSSIFGSKTKTTPFGSAQYMSDNRKGAINLSNNNKDTTFSHAENTNTSSLSPPSAHIVKLPEADTNLTNGEENEDTIISLRVKLFKLVKKDTLPTNQLSTPRASSSTSKSGKKVGIEMATKIGEVDTGVSANTSTNSAEGSSKMDWKEVGIGPLRVLTDSKNARIVQRRENTPGGQGTKLILNVRLGSEVGTSVERMGDKFVRLLAFEVVQDENKCIEDTKDEENSYENQKANEINHGQDTEMVTFAPVQYLFKVKTIQEAELLFGTLKKYCKTI